MSSSLLLQQCPAYLARLTWIVFVMGGRWPYSWCFVGCYRQDLFNIARNILVYLPSESCLSFRSHRNNNTLSSNNILKEPIIRPTSLQPNVRLNFLLSSVSLLTNRLVLFVLCAPHQSPIHGNNKLILNIMSESSQYNIISPLKNMSFWIPPSRLLL